MTYEFIHRWLAMTMLTMHVVSINLILLPCQLIKWRAEQDWREEDDGREHSHITMVTRFFFVKLLVISHAWNQSFSIFLTVGNITVICTLTVTYLKRIKMTSLTEPKKWWNINAFWYGFFSREACTLHATADPPYGEGDGERDGRRRMGGTGKETGERTVVHQKNKSAFVFAWGPGPHVRTLGSGLGQTLHGRPGEVLDQLTMWENMNTENN